MRHIVVDHFPVLTLPSCLPSLPPPLPFLTSLRSTDEQPGGKNAKKDGFGFGSAPDATGGYMEIDGTPVAEKAAKKPAGAGGGQKAKK